MACTENQHKVHQMMKHKVHHHENKLIPVHISKEEIIGFNRLQATEENPTGQYVDPKTGLREYSRLSHILKEPAVRDVFIELAKGARDPSELPQAIVEQMQIPLPDDMFVFIPSDNDPTVSELAHDVTTADDEYVVMMPIDVVHFLSFLQGGTHPEPFHGLPQFGLFGKIFSGNPIKSVVRVVTTVAGAGIGFAAGGPAGAAAGAYAGNTLGRGLTGQSFTGPNAAWKAALPNALYGYGAGAGLSALGVGAPAGAAAPIVNGSTGLVQAPGSASGLVSASSVTPTATAAVTPGLSAITPGAAAATPMTKTIAPSFLSSMGSKAMEYLPSVGLMAGGYMLGKKGDTKREQEHKDYSERKERGIGAARDRYMSSGIEGQIYEHEPHTFNPNYGRATNNTYKSLEEFEKEWRDKDYGRKSRFKKGGLVVKLDVAGTPLKGKGDGQSDSINKDIPEYTWIHDAHTVSALGNGSSDAGHKEIKQFEKFIRRDLLPHYKDELKHKVMQMPGRRLRKVPCAVATDEYQTPAMLVGALGEGSFEKGGQVLRKVTKSIRRHKTSKPDELPPASLGLMAYYKKAVKGR